MNNPVDPLIAAQERIQFLERELAETRQKTKRLLEDRKVWPKLVCVSVSKGKWGEEVAEAFAEIGWLPNDLNLGPCSGGKYICAQAWLYYEAQEDGGLKLVGARDKMCGKVGVTDNS